MPSNSLHSAFRNPSEEAEQLRLIAEDPALLEEEDDSWEAWLPLHNAARWGASAAAVRAAVSACPNAAKTSSKGGYEPLHLAAMGGHVEVIGAIVEMYPEGALKHDNNGRTPLDEAREGSSPAHEKIVELLLALPGVKEADEAEQQLRASRAAALMRTDDDEDDADFDAVLEERVGRSVVAGAGARAAQEQQAVSGAALSAEGAEESPAADDSYLLDGSMTASARSLASRMLRAASSALWRSEADEAEEQQSREEMASFFTERAKYIPLRLELRERKYLRLLEGILHVSEYTDKVDSPGVSANPAKRKQAMLRELHAVLSGLLLSCDYEAGQAAMADRSFADYPDFFAPLFEVTRRYKIMNPEKMRDTYGKMIYLLQDANTEEMVDELGFELVTPIKTVHAKLKECGALALLSDEHIATATQLVSSPSHLRSISAASM